MRRLIKPVTPAQLVKWGVLKPSGKSFDATNAYALLTGNDLFAPVVKCAVFKGATRSIFIDRREFGCPVDVQIEEAYKYVLSKINLGSVFGEGIHRKDVYEIPPSAIREIIVNAVVHRNYVNGEESPITVALYDDRLEVTSPGKLPYGVTVAKMREGCSECRNKALAQVLAYMNIIEDWGSGIPRISADIKDSGLRDLEISDWPNAVRTVIYRHKEPKADIEHSKADIQSQKVDIESHLLESLEIHKSANRNPADGIEWPESWPESWPKSWPESWPESNENKILSLLWFGEKSKKELAGKIGIAADAHSLKAAIRSLLEDKKYIEQTIKDKPMSRLQKYRLTLAGISHMKKLFTFSEGNL